MIKPKQPLKRMWGLQQASFSKSEKSIASELATLVKAGKAEIRKCPDGKNFTKKRYKEFGVCYKVPKGKILAESDKHIVGFLGCFHCETVISSRWKFLPV